MRTSKAVTLIVSVGLSGACGERMDTVAPGDYGVPPMAASTSPRPSATATSVGAAQGGAAGVASEPPRPGNSAQPSSSAATPGRSSAAGAAANAPTMTSSQAAGSMQPSAASGDCDMSGRWIASYHLVVDALGESQYTHYIHYFEIDQQGTDFTVTKGLLCDTDSIGTGDFAATSKFEGARNAITTGVNYKGMTGSSVADPGGCKLDIQKWYTVRGMTASFYVDPANALPTVDDKADGNKPGWEDWDMDGNPGITGIVSGIVSGKIFVAPRMWTSTSAVVPDVSTTFKAITQWNSEQNMLSYDGTPLLASEAVRAADPNVHFVEMTRLTADQAADGDDIAICKSILALAPMLTPSGTGIMQTVGN